MRFAGIRLLGGRASERIVIVTGPWALACENLRSAPPPWHGAHLAGSRCGAPHWYYHEHPLPVRSTGNLRGPQTSGWARGGNRPAWPLLAFRSSLRIPDGVCQVEVGLPVYCIWRFCEHCRRPSCRPAPPGPPRRRPPRRKNRPLGRRSAATAGPAIPRPRRTAGPPYQRRLHGSRSRRLARHCSRRRRGIAAQPAGRPSSTCHARAAPMPPGRRPVVCLSMSRRCSGCRSPAANRGRSDSGPPRPARCPSRFHSSRHAHLPRSRPRAGIRPWPGLATDPPIARLRSSRGG